MHPPFIYVKGGFLMKKFILLLMTITIVSLVSDINCEKTIIPKEAIRFRVIANSNSQEDQNLKVKVKDNLEKDISKVLKNETTLISSRTALENIKIEDTKVIEKGEPLFMRLNAEEEIEFIKSKMKN